MDTSGNIRYITPKDEFKENEIPLEEEEAKKLKKVPKAKRKNWMRNKPCICGSGKKMKHCCWSKLTKMGMDLRRT